MTTFQKYLKYKNKYINYKMEGGVMTPEQRKRERAIEKIIKEQNYTKKATRGSLMSPLALLSKPTLFYVEEIDEFVKYGVPGSHDYDGVVDPIKLRKAAMSHAYEVSETLRTKMRNEFSILIERLDLDKSDLDKIHTKVIEKLDDLINFTRLQIALSKDEIRKIVKDFLDKNNITNSYAQKHIIDRIILERDGDNKYYE